MSVIAPEESTYNGSPVLKIHLGKKYQSEEEDFLIIGTKKANAICDSIDHIRRFAEKHEKKGGARK